MRTKLPIFAKRSQKSQRRGATAVEFAFVALPFFMLLFGLFEVMRIFLFQTTLEHAIAEESRKIKTGQANAGAGTNAVAFKAGVCARMMGLADCSGRLFVIVQNQPAVGSLSSPLTDPNLLATPPYQQNTAAGSIVVVRGVYMLPLMVPGLTTAFQNTTSSGPASNLGASNRMLIATSAFRNEPFQ